jgi:starvation-inducible DNA-binding protein
LGGKVAGTFEDFTRLANVKSGNKDATSGQMLADLLHDHAVLEQTLAKALDVAHEAKDEVVTAYIGERMTAHRKTAWMLKSSIVE